MSRYRLWVGGGDDDVPGGLDQVSEIASKRSGADFEAACCRRVDQVDAALVAERIEKRGERIVVGNIAAGGRPELSFLCACNAARTPRGPATLFTTSQSADMVSSTASSAHSTRAL